MKGNQVETWRDAFLISIAIIGVTALHYATDTRMIVLHEAFQRFYYLPIIYAAYRYGVRSGLATSLFSAAIYIPHVYFHWENTQVYALSQYWEMTLFQVIALVTGMLSNAERRERQKNEKSANQLRAAYAELEATVERLVAAERMASIAQLTLSLAHEIRNPLGAIRGATEVLETYSLPNGSGEFLGIIHTEVNGLNRLVSDFLAFGRPRQPEKMTTHPNEVAHSALTLVRKRAADQGVKLRTDFQESIPAILVDPEQVKQSVVNLVQNGLDAMPEGGTLSVTTQVAEGKALIRVSDTGPGLTPNARENLFRPFLTTKAKGTGLGLAISQRLISQNGGTITLVENGPPATTFEIGFPL